MSLRPRLHVDNIKESVFWVLEACLGGDLEGCESLWTLPGSLVKNRLGLSQEAFR